MNKTISFIIPNFNGKEILAKNLPNLIEKIQRERIAAQVQEIIVVDDGSSDGSIDFIHKNFPQVKIVALERNYGFAYACNVGVREAKGDIIYLLNSDVRVCDGFLGPLMSYFVQKDIFAVGSIEVESEDHTHAQLPKYVSIPLVKLKYGILWYWYQDIPASLAKGGIETFCVSAGHSAYDREKFLSLGGFDTIFRPFYAEDGDICWRAWKRGWKSLHEPQSMVVHKFKSTIGKYYTRTQTKVIHWKNRFLFTWKDIISGGLILEHLFFLIPELCILPFCGRKGKEFTLGFFKALGQLPELWQARRRDKIKEPFYSDRQMFKRFSGYTK